MNKTDRSAAIFSPGCYPSMVLNRQKPRLPESSRQEHPPSVLRRPAFRKLIDRPKQVCRIRATMNNKNKSCSSGSLSSVVALFTGMHAAPSPWQ
eukprot:1160741-Pelagomonas_calceolata.AAC.1